ncbi:MAG: efflux RND transporter periplasmic adaptor subunit [Pseudomonadales bacterium]
MLASLRRYTYCLLGLYLLTGCGADTAAPEAQPIRPVKIFTVEGDAGAGVRQFPGRIDASQRAELAFRVSGTVQKLYVGEGDEVSEGQLLAQLDPTDFAITVQDKQAVYDKNKRNFERAQDLIVDGNISRLDFDRMEAELKTSTATLTQAKQNLAYTELRAPFEGRLAKRYIDNFEEVTAKELIFNVQNINQLEVKIDLPESLIRKFRSNPAKNSKEDTVNWVTFEGRRDNKFDLVIKEAATKADSQTQTYEVTFGLPAPSDFLVLPGMTATVHVDFSRLISQEEAHWVPVKAVVADSGLEALVWILNRDTLTVSKRDITIGRMSGSQIEVTSGLLAGDEIISVGASYLAEGMEVTRMKLSEQAVPRASDPS